MATLPIDASKIDLIATGKARPVKVYAEMNDGSRRAVPDSQDKNEHGTPLWTIDVQYDPDPDNDESRMEAIGVKVASAEKPQVKAMQPVQFEGLTCRPYVDKKSGWVALSMRAEGIATGKSSGSSRGAAASEGAA